MGSLQSLSLRHSRSIHFPALQALVASLQSTSTLHSGRLPSVLPPSVPLPGSWFVVSVPATGGVEHAPPAIIISANIKQHIRDLSPMFFRLSMPLTSSKFIHIQRSPKRVAGLVLEITRCDLLYAHLFLYCSAEQTRQTRGQLSEFRTFAQKAFTARMASYFLTRCQPRARHRQKTELCTPVFGLMPSHTSSFKKIVSAVQVFAGVPASYVDVRFRSATITV